MPAAGTPDSAPRLVFGRAGFKLLLQLWEFPSELRLGHAMLFDDLQVFGLG